MLLLVFIFVFLILLLYSCLFKNTVFDFSIKRRNYLGFFFIYEYLIYIAPCAILLHVNSIDNFWVAFKVDQSKVTNVTFLVLFSYIYVLFFIYLFQKLHSNSFVVNKNKIKLDLFSIYKYKKFTEALVAFGALLILYVYITTGVSHSFYTSVVDNSSIAITRYDLAEIKGLGYVKNYLIVSSYLATCILASPVYSRFKVSKVLMLILVAVGCTYFGSKGPLLTMILIYFVSYVSYSRTIIESKHIIIGFLFVLVFLSIVYRVVLFQYSDLSNFEDFWNYFYQRVFVAQMIGVYEQFSLNIINFDYIYNSIPFASNFHEVSNFHKDLMMISEDRIDPLSIGIKNSYFLAEAYAIFGVSALFFAPIIYSVNYCISYLLLLKVFNLFVCRNSEFNKYSCSIFLFSYLNITGGFSEVLFLKLIVMVIIMLVPVLLLHCIRFSTLRRFL